ncbi:hypothetical protein D3C72_1977980 [compost metagenome]
MLRSGCSRVVMITRSLTAKCSQPIVFVTASKVRSKSTSVPCTMSSDTVMAAWVSWLVSVVTAAGGRLPIRSMSAGVRASESARCSQIQPSPLSRPSIEASLAIR